MIFRRALYRELTMAAVTVFSVLISVIATILVTRFLGEAASGLIAGGAIMAFIGFNLITYLPVVLSLTLFIAILVTLTRCYRDSEMAVWFGSGVSLSAWVRPVLYFSVPIVVVIAVVSLLLAPWALRQGSEYKRQLESRDDVSTVMPGLFKESRRSSTVYFVEKFDKKKNSFGNIFMQSMAHHKLSILVAKNGYQEIAKNGDKFMVLLNGRRYQGIPGDPAYKIMTFGRYAVRIQPFEAKYAAFATKAKSTLQLLARPTPANRGELLWRLGLPVSALILALLAIPLSFVNPRAGRSMNLIFAILIYMIYSNFISISQAWVAQGRLAFPAGLLGVHLAMVVVLLLLFFHRLSVHGLFFFLKGK